MNGYNNEEVGQSPNVSRRDTDLEVSNEIRLAINKVPFEKKGTTRKTETIV
jgi:hypothetical protein